MTPLRIATRGSALALWQANFIAACLRPRVAPRLVELVEVKSAGDLNQTSPLAAVGGAGLFTKEIQLAVLDGRADLAVHSLKDLPTEAEPGLVLAAVPERGPTADGFISLKHASFDSLPRGGRLATGSPRRQAQLRHRRPDLKLEELRGNVDTRLRKLETQELDAILLAVAGLERLGLAHRITERLDESWMLPAVGQGALGVECRQDDLKTLALLSGLNHLSTRAAILAERALLRGLGGGCQLPLGALAVVENGTLRLRAALTSLDGARQALAEQVGPLDKAESVGLALAAQLKAGASADLLA